MKNFGFVTLNDGSCFKDLQVVMNREALENYDEIAHQNVSAALVCTGELKLTPDAPQPFELAATDIVVEGVSAPDYPLQKKRATVEFLRTQQHLRPRTNLFRAVFRVRSVAAAAIHRFFQDRGFIYVNTPIITASDCEGAGEMFRVTTMDPANPPLDEHGNVDFSQDFFGTACLSYRIRQLNAENFAMAFGDVYTFGPTFRAENSNTTRHAAEFWMIEPEIAFADLADDMDLAEDMLKYVIRDVMDRCSDELAMLNKFVDKGLIERLTHVAGSDFACVSYTEAVEILEQAVAAGHKFDYPVSWGIDLQTEHERFLTEEHFKCPTFVTDYPAEIKAFYMRSTMTARPWPLQTAWFPVSARSSAALSARSVSTCSSAVSPNLAWMPSSTSTISTFAVMELASTPALAGLRAPGHVPHGRGQHPRRPAASAYRR